MANAPFPSFDFDTDALSSRLSGRLKWIVLAAILVALLFLLSIGKSAFTDWLWFKQLGFQGIFVKVILTKLSLFAVSAMVAMTIIGINLALVTKFSSGVINLPVAEQLTGLIKKGLTVVPVIATIGIAIVFSLLFSSQWELLLRFTNSVGFEVSDPMFNKDISFYIFDLPAYSFIQGWLVAVFVVGFIATSALSFAHYALRGVSFSLTPVIRNQLVVNAAIIVLLISIGHYISRYELVSSPGGLVFGATYVDVNIKKHTLLVLAVSGVLLSIFMLVVSFMDRLRLIVGGVAVWVVMILALGSLWPSVVQQITVNPNEFVKEKEFIERNIEFTRYGYGLKNIDQIFYETEGEITSELVSENRATTDNIRLWDYRPLTNVYKQIQLIRPYYDFKDADVDRYTINGDYRQVLLAAREVAPEKLDESAQTWTNRKLYYTHGIGIAMSPVTEFTTEGRPVFFAKDIPSDGQIPIGSQETPLEPDILVENPRIYYGENTEDYVIVDSNYKELDYQTGEGVLQKIHYDGEGGVEVGSLFRKLVYAWQMGDLNLLISGEIGSDSRIQYRRNIQERIQEVAPFLSLDGDPYIVADGGKLVWVQDAYTTSNNFPYSDPYVELVTEVSVKKYNYVRNSVKVVVGAYDGDMDFYLWERDPIAETYAKIFPALFTDRSSMPESLREHMRYPQGLFSMQASKYLRYHMDDPQHFYGNEDLWSLPQEKFGQGETLQVVEPYYVIMKLPGEEKEEFVLLTPYTPKDRPNMVGWLAARSDGENYGRLLAFNFPKDRQVDGPEQVEARIDNDQDISAWFTLRCAEGSTCIRGNLLVIPIGSSILYAEPVYIQAEGVSFPELKKVILATAEKVVMADSLDEALYELTGVIRTEPVEGHGKNETEHQSKNDKNNNEIIPSPFISDEILEHIDKIRNQLSTLEELLKESNESGKSE